MATIIRNKNWEIIENLQNMNFHYLHIQAAILLLEVNGADLSLELDSVVCNSMFQSVGFWGMDKLSTQFLTNRGNKISFEEFCDIKYGPNVLDAIDRGVVNDVPKCVYRLQFFGIPGIDDMGVYSNAYLVVSEKGLAALRNEGVLQAEADLIDVPIEEYFTTNRQFFLDARTAQDEVY